MSRGTEDNNDVRRGVEWLILLRLLITVFILSITIFFYYRQYRYFEVHPATPLFVLLGAVFALSLLYLFSLNRIADLSRFSFFQILVDTVYSTVLVQLTGGASSSFTPLYVMPILAAGILHLRKGALIIASISSVLMGLLITLQFYDFVPASQWPWASLWRNQDPGYVLWVLVIHFALFFAVALLAGTVSQELRNTRISLTLREMEYDRLSDLHTNIIKSIPSGIITSDETGFVTFVNEVAARLLRVEPSSLLGRPLASAFGDLEDLDVATREIRTLTLALEGELGQDREIDLSVGRLWDRNETPLGCLAIFQDVTDLKKMERQAQQSERQAAFVRIASGMAHEIRNPLASLRGAAELLTKRVDDPVHRQKLLAIIIREADRLNALLSDFILTVNGRHANFKRLPVREIVTDVLSEFERTYCEPNGLRLIIEKVESIEISGQPDRLKQALSNVLINAAEASQAGGEIRVSVFRGRGQVVISIEDSGSGIPPEVKDRIFEPFYTTKSFGTGLGLPMALSIVEAHGGSMELMDSKPQGTACLIRLPIPDSERS